MPKLKIYQEERPWGYFRRFCQNTPVTVKVIVIKPGEIFSLQSHTKHTEFWRVISGSGEAVIDSQTKPIKPSDELTIPAGTKHRLAAGAYGLEVLEISVGEFDENDIVRYEDKYGRQ